MNAALVLELQFSALVKTGSTSVVHDCRAFNKGMKTGTRVKYANASVSKYVLHSQHCLEVCYSEH